MRLLTLGQFKRIKELQEAKFSPTKTSGILGNSISTIKKVYALETYQDYLSPAAPLTPPEHINPTPSFDQVTTVLTNIANELTAIDQRLESLEAAHETKFSFFRGR